MLLAPVSHSEHFDQGLTDAGARDSAYSSEDYGYLRNPTWWAGITTRMFKNCLRLSTYSFSVVLGESRSVCKATFSNLIEISSRKFCSLYVRTTNIGDTARRTECTHWVGCLTIKSLPSLTLHSAVLASFLLNEELGHLGRTGCALCLIGSFIIVLHAPADKEVETVDEILHYAIQPGKPSQASVVSCWSSFGSGFVLYCLTVFVFSVVMIFNIAPRYGRSNPLVYISICSLVGSVSVMAIKGFGVAVKLTLSGNNQFTHPSTYVFGIVVVGCILVQMNFFNKALDTFSTNVYVYQFNLIPINVID